jgi:hypothetical protein
MTKSRRLAATLCAALAAGPALASSTTIIDFEVLITENDVDSVIFDSLLPGTTVAGVLEFDPATPDLIVPELFEGEFALDSLMIGDVDAALTPNPVARLGGANSISSFFSDGTTTVSLFIEEGSPADGDLDSLSVDDVLSLINTGEFNLFGSIAGESFFIGGEPGNATARPHVPDSQVIPLPAAGWLMLAGLGGLAALRRRAS